MAKLGPYENDFDFVLFETFTYHIRPPKTWTQNRPIDDGI